MAKWGDGERGTLTAFPTEGSWINAILVQGISEDQFEEYRQREQGYTIMTVQKEVITPYDEKVQIEQSAKIAVGKLWLDSVEPIPEYKQLCFDGAKTWGDEFHSDFVETTFDSVKQPNIDINIRKGFEEQKFSDLEVE